MATSYVTLRFNLTVPAEHEKELLQLHTTVTDVVKGNSHFSNAHVALNYSQRQNNGERSSNNSGRYGGRGRGFRSHGSNGRGRSQQSSTVDSTTSAN